MLRRMYSFSFSMKSCCFSKARCAVRIRSAFWLPVRRIAARVVRQAAVLEVHDLFRHPVQETAVVRHDEVGALRPSEVVLEKLHGLEVEVVRRLVEEKDVGRREDGAREHGPVLLASRELREGPLEVGLLETEAGQRLVDLGHHLVASLVLEAVREGVVLVVQRGRGVPLRHPVLEVPELGFDDMERREGAGGEVVELLGQIRRQGLVHGRDAHRVGLDELAAVGLFATQGDPQERRLPGAVPADETDFLAGIVLPDDVPEDLLRAIALADVIEAIQHGGILQGRPSATRERPDLRSGRARRRRFGPATAHGDAGSARRKSAP